MDRPSNQDRQGRRYQPAQDDGNRFDARERRANGEQHAEAEERESDRSLRNGRYYRDEAVERSWNQEHHERYETRPRYQDLGGQSSSNRHRAQYEDSNLDGRNSGPSSAWDDRPSSNQGDGSSYPTSSYGSSFNGGPRSSMDRNANHSSYGNAYRASSERDDQGNFGSYGSSRNLGSRGYEGSQQWQSQGSQGPSPTHYGTQHAGSDFGQHYGTGQTLYGNDTFAANKTGRGPKGYKRSDERIKEEVCDLLTRHPEIDPSEVDITVTSSEIILSGTVGNRREKRLIEDLVSNVSGVTDVNNELRVFDAKNSSKDQSSDSSSMRTGISEQKSSDQGSQASTSVQ